MPARPSAATGSDAPRCFKFEHVENLAARGEQPAERVGQREGYALALAVIKLVAVGIGGVLQVVE